MNPDFFEKKNRDFCFIFAFYNNDTNPIYYIETQ